MEKLDDFLLDGAKILHEAWNFNATTKKYDDVLVPIYDNEESVCGIIYNDVPYYFQKNQQGDIIAILDKNGDTVARYTYDAWGKVTVFDTNGADITDTTTHIANINPFRYRGYYYDAEIGLYYVSSRYYDPEIGRFVNADEIENALYLNNVLDHNIFTYVQNNPVIFSDSTGENWITDLWKKVKNGASSAWNWLKKAYFTVGRFFKNTVWKKWIVNGFWKTFCKKWVWETFCKKMVYNTFLKKWVWETFCKKWVWETFCKKWVWQTFCKKWVWETFCKKWVWETFCKKWVWNTALPWMNQNPIFQGAFAIIGFVLTLIGIKVSAAALTVIGIIMGAIDIILWIRSLFV